MSRGTAALLAVSVAAGIGAALGAWARSDSSARLELTRGVPTEASPEQLRTLAGAEGVALYWAGPLRGRRLELTRTSRGTFVRYLPSSALIGDNRSLYLTVATYRMPDAYDAATKAARSPGAVVRRAPDRGLVVWHAKRNTSVYLAHAGAAQLIEVFAPDPRRARDLLLSGRVRPVGE
jgi:hypothetical protein